MSDTTDKSPEEARHQGTHVEQTRADSSPREQQQTQHDHPQPGKEHHSRLGEHPHLTDLPPPSLQFTQPTSADPAAGSPKTAFSADLPTRIASRELKKPFNLHSQAEGLSPEEQACLRHEDIRRILSSIQILGYETPAPLSAFIGPTIAFFTNQSDSVQRMLALVAEVHGEFDSVLSALRHVDRDNDDQSQDDQIKEEILSQLFFQVMPAVEDLSGRVARETTAAAESLRGAVRLSRLENHQYTVFGGAV